jgi:hypothetical protein
VKIGSEGIQQLRLLLLNPTLSSSAITCAFSFTTSSISIPTTTLSNPLLRRLQQLPLHLQFQYEEFFCAAKAQYVNISVVQNIAFLM